MIVTEGAARQVVAYIAESSRQPLAPGGKVLISKRYDVLSPLGPRQEYEGEIVTVASEVTLFPTRFWRAQSLASWGREVYVKLPDRVALVPGEAVNVRFLDAGGGLAAASAGLAAR